MSSTSSRHLAEQQETKRDLTECWQGVTATLEQFNLIQRGIVTQQEVDYLGSLPADLALADNPKGLEILYRILKSGNQKLTLERLQRVNSSGYDPDYDEFR